MLVSESLSSCKQNTLLCLFREQSSLGVMACLLKTRQSRTIQSRPSPTLWSRSRLARRQRKSNDLVASKATVRNSRCSLMRGLYALTNFVIAEGLKILGSRASWPSTRAFESKPLRLASRTCITTSNIIPGNPAANVTVSGRMRLFRGHDREFAQFIFDSGIPITKLHVGRLFAVVTNALKRNDRVKTPVRRLVRLFEAICEPARNAGENTDPDGSRIKSLGSECTVGTAS
jgi:hypothetical protein